MLTTDPKDPELCHGIDTEPVNQCKKYLILSEKERAKGFVRPVRYSYIHKGRYYPYSVEKLNQPYNSEDGRTYVAKVVILLDIDGKPKCWGFLTQREYDQYIKTNGYVGGCFEETKMGIELAETYARDPKFYGATYCIKCKMHLPVSEFSWIDDGELVGS